MAFQPIIYSFGAGDYLNSIFESLSILFDFNKHNEMLWIGRIAGLLGVISIALGSFASRGRDGSPGALDWTWFLRFAMIWLVIIVPKVDLRIEDLTNKKTFVVTGAPWALSVFGWFTSSIGYGFTNLYENVLGGGMNPVESYSGNGIAFGSRYYNTLPKIAKFDNMTMNNYVKPFIIECLVPAVTKFNVKNSGLTKEAFFSTPSYSASITSLNSNWLKNRYVYTDQGTLTCFELRDAMIKQWEPDSILILKKANLSEQMVGDLDNAFIKQATDASASSLKQGMMINAIYDSVSAQAVQYGDAALADSLSQAQAQYQQVSAWKQGSQFASVSLVWLHIVAESIVYAIWPLLCFIFLLPVGFSVIIEYIKVLFWLQTWPVLYAILNSIISVYATSKSQALALQYSGFTMSNFYQIGDLNGGVVATAGYLSTLVPILSWVFLQRAGSAIMSGASALVGSVNNTAETVGKQEQLGSMDINRVSVRNSNTAGESTTGMETKRDIGRTGTETDIGGYKTVQSRAMDNKIASSIDYAKSAQNQISNMTQSVRQRAGQESQQWNKVAESMHNAAINTSGGHSSTSGDGGKNSNVYNRGSELAADVAVKAQAVAKAELSAFGFGVDTQFGAEGKMMSKAAQGYKQALDKYNDYANKHNLTTDNIVGDGFKSSQGLAQSSSETSSAALSVSRAQTKLSSMGDTIKTSGDNAFVQDLMAQGMSAQEINDMQAHDLGKFNQLAQKFAEEKFVPQILGDKTDYSVQSVDIAGTKKTISGLASKYRNRGNIDRYTSIAIDGINQEEQTITTDQNNINQKRSTQASKYDNNKSQAMGENIYDSTTSAVRSITDGPTEPLKGPIKRMQEGAVKNMENKDGTTGKSGYPEYTDKK